MGWLTDLRDRSERRRRTYIAGGGVIRRLQLVSRQMTDGVPDGGDQRCNRRALNSIREVAHDDKVYSGGHATVQSGVDASVLRFPTCLRTDPQGGRIRTRVKACSQLLSRAFAETSTDLHPPPE
jgi:hypothetical protein